MATLQAQRFGTHHADYVHDVKFDHYGKRLATCSADQTVRVWDMDDNGGWVAKDGSELKNAHQMLIWRLAWAHPEFGQVLATCSADHTVKVWEEQESLQGEDASGGQSRWYSRAHLADSRKEVRDIEFAPRHLGLKLATGSADGTVRVYEAIDVMNLSHWPLQASFDTEPSAERPGVVALSWCKSRFDHPMIAMGLDNGRVQVWWHDDRASKGWQMQLELDGHDRGINDVDWAPNAGRSHHLIATAGKDCRLKVHRLKRSGGTVQGTSVSQLNVPGEVYRCEWNVTGSALATSGDEPVVRVWKADYRGDWLPVTEMQADLGEADEGIMDIDRR